MAAIAKHLAANGDDLDKSMFAAEAAEWGVSRATCYRWINDALVLHHAGQLAGGTGSPPLSPGADDPGDGLDTPEILPAMPHVPSMNDVARLGLLPVVTLLRECIAHAQALINHATAPDGGVRNAKLLLHASEHLRRAIETAARINDSIGITQEMDRFHAILMEEIVKEPPAVQERVLVRLRSACEMVLQDAA